MDKIIIYKNDSFKNFVNEKEYKIVKFEDLVLSLNKKFIFRNIFKFKEAVFFSYRNNVVARPFFISAFLKTLSPFNSSFKDVCGKTERIDFKKLLLLFANYLNGFINSGQLISKADCGIEYLTQSIKKRNRVRAIMGNSPVYLRTDMSFNVVSGGSVGHIAGVLNNLQHFTGEPLFLTSDSISTVSPEINTYVIHPDRKYSDFRELWPLYYNTVFEKAVEKLKIDFPISFIYQRYSINNFCGLKLSLKYNVPFVLEYNGSEVWINKHWGKALKHEKLSEKIEMANLKCSDLIVVVSKVMKNELVNRGIEDKKILVNPNGVDPDRYSPVIDGSDIREKYSLNSKLVIGFIGTFGKWHGAELLAEAFGRLLKKHPEYDRRIMLLMVGDGVTMPLVKHNLKKYNIESQSILTGLVPQGEGAKYLAACDILVSPHIPNSDGTPFFGSPTKLFEYMAMGKGIVASDLEQIGEILEHNQTAYMVKPGEVDDLVQGIKVLIDDSGLRKKLGERARTKAVENYTWKEHTRKIIEKLKDLCNSQL